MRIRTAPLLVAMLLASLLPLATPAQADTGPVDLGMSTFSRIVVDEANGHLFFSPGRSGNGVRVTDLQGQFVATVGDLSGEARHRLRQPP